MTIRVVPILDGLKWETNAPEENFEVDDEGRFAALVLRPHPDDADESSPMRSGR